MIETESSEDSADIAIATERLKNPGKRYSRAQVVENLRLDDLHDEAIARE